MSEVQIKGQSYLLGKINGRKQFHIVRRLTPMMRHLTPLFRNAQQTLVSDENGAMVPIVSGISLFDGIAALSETIGEIPDHEADYVIDGCLDAVKFASGGGWAPLRAAGSPLGGGIMLPAVAEDMALQLRLTWEVLVENLANFTVETLLPSQTGQANGMMASP